MTTPHEPGLGRRIMAMEADGFFVSDRGGRFYWWEAQFGTRYDIIPIEAEGPFPSFVAALTAAEKFHEANPA